MVADLLKTKLYPPPLRADLLPRPHLLRKMNRAARHKLTLVSAPAGFAKTTVVAAWAHEATRAVAWLSLDEDDNDLRRFLSYLAAALQAADACSAETRRTIAASESIAPKPLVTLLVNDILGSARHLTLILDDYHQIDSPDVHETVEMLLAYQPPQMQLVLSTRVDPPLPLSRLRAQGEMTEIRVEELRFSATEAAAFLQETMAVRDLTRGEVEMLEAQTEGWPAGLQLVALSLKKQDDRAAFIRALTGTNRYILDYLMDEVFSQQSREIQHFLLHSSVLKQMNGPLCDAVVYEDTAGKRSQSTLEHLERANLFVVPLDDRRGWYRYHHLFAELLRYRLQREARPEIATLHLRASKWYEAQRMFRQAIDHARKAGAEGRVADLIEHHGHRLFGQGALSSVVDWLGDLPLALLSTRPGLCMIYGWALTATGQGAEVGPWLQLVEQSVGTTVGETLDGTPPPAISGALVEVASLRAVIAVDEGDYKQARQLGRWALAHLESAQRFLFHKREHLRPVLFFNQGRAQAALGSLDAAQDAFLRAAEAASDQNMHIVALALGHRGNLLACAGDLHAAAAVYRRALARAQAARARGTPFTALDHAGLGHVLYEWNELEAAERHFERALALARPLGHWDSLVAATTGLALLYRARGELDGALSTLEAFEELRLAFAVHEPVPAVEALRAWLALEVEGAAAVRREHLVAPSPAGLAAVIIGRALLALEQPEAVLSSTARAVEEAVAGGQRQTAIRLLLLRARALSRQGAQEQAYEAVCRALRLAEPGGYIRAFVDEGPDVAQFVYRAAAEDLLPEYAGRVLAAFAEGELAAPRRPPQADSLVEPLSEREVEVVALIAEGLTNREIAQRLSIALGTVKTHTYNIYRKLEVNSRTQAVARAHSLGILRP